MKTLASFILVFTLCGFAPVASSADEVKVGDSRDAVLKALGDPSGTASFGTSEVLHYPRGQVDLKDGKVVGSTVISQAEFDRRERQRAAEAERLQKEAAERAAAAPPPAALAPAPNTREMSPAEEVAYWETYQRENPGAPVSGQLAAARQRAEEQARKDAEIEAKVQEGMRDPPSDMSSRKMRKYRRGRSESQLEAREKQLREQLAGE